jgi:PAS domain S-box-containing protein
MRAPHRDARLPDSAGRARFADASRFYRQLPAIAATAALYFIAGKLGLKLAFLHASATAVWPPTGIALAVFLLFGTRLWPGVFLGAFLVNITTAGSALTALGIATGNTLEGLLGAWLVDRFANGRRAFERPQDVVRFWALACIVSTAVSATLGVTSLCVTRFAPWSAYGPIWLTWWLGDGVGGFVVASLLILWHARPRPEWGRAETLEIALLLVGLVAAGLIVFTGSFSHPYVCLPVLLWIAFRFGQREAATATFALCVIAVWGTLRGTGPFVAETRNGSLLLLQAFAGVTAVTTMAVAAVAAERKRAVEALRGARDQLEVRVKERTEALTSANEALRSEIAERKRAETRFRRLLESAPDAMVIVDQHGKILLVNSRTESMFGYNREELIGRTVETLVPDRLRGVHGVHRSGYHADPHVRPMGLGIDLRGRRRDGTEFPVEIALGPIETEEGVLVCAAVRDTTEQKEMERQLDEVARRRAEDLRDFAVSVQGAQEEERRRIARELHDDLGQRLTGLKLGLQVLEEDIPRGNRKQTERLERLMHEIDRMIAEIRRLSYNLRPAALDDFGLVVALQMLCKEFEKVYRIGTKFHEGEPPGRIHDSAVDIAVYRIAQEALANVARHSGATAVSVRLSRDGDEIGLAVEDNGRGFDVDAIRGRNRAGRGLGLVGMRERSELLGGTFEVESGPGQGTRIRVRLPLSQKSDGTNQDTHSR